ncbi:hypothetical protein KEM52_004390, partial [Ascosphaera acerosa]
MLERPRRSTGNGSNDSNEAGRDVADSSSRHAARPASAARTDDSEPVVVPSDVSSIVTSPHHDSEDTFSFDDTRSLSSASAASREGGRDGDGDTRGDGDGHGDGDGNGSLTTPELQGCQRLENDSPEQRDLDKSAVIMPQLNDSEATCTPGTGTGAESRPEPPSTREGRNDDAEGRQGHDEDDSAQRDGDQVPSECISTWLQSLRPLSKTYHILGNPDEPPPPPPPKEYRIRV